MSSCPEIGARVRTSREYLTPGKEAAGNISGFFFSGLAAPGVLGVIALAIGLYLGPEPWRRWLGTDASATMRVRAVAPWRQAQPTVPERFSPWPRRPAPGRALVHRRVSSASGRRIAATRCSARGAPPRRPTSQRHLARSRHRPTRWPGPRSPWESWPSTWRPSRKHCLTHQPQCWYLRRLLIRPNNSNRRFCR